MKKNMVAFDCGNSSFRVLLGTYDGNQITTEVISQIPNYMVRLHQYDYWDILMIYHGLLDGLKKAVKKAGTVDSVGICTWGVDFALFNGEGLMLQNPLSYRNSIGAEVLQGISGGVRDALYEETGILCDKINSVYMLMGMKEKMPRLFEQGERLLMIPDILNYLFTGVMVNEPSELSTTQLMDARTRQVSPEALKLAGIPGKLFGPVAEHGTLIGMLGAEIKESLGIDYDIPVVCVPSHDTAAAVLAIPAEEEEFLFVSSGTWALIGMELKAPVVNDEVKRCCLTNEIGAFDRITLLKNSAGMFLVQRLKEEYERERQTIGWEEFNALGDEYEGNALLFDVNHQAFFNPENMSDAIWAYLTKTKQVSGSKNWTAVVRSFQQSAAYSFAASIEDLEHVSGYKKEKIYMVGGGSKNVRLCQMTADLTGKTVVTGGGESTCLGNLAAQIKYFEPEKSIWDLRAVIGSSIEMTEYHCREKMTDALRRYQTLLG